MTDSPASELLRLEEDLLYSEKANFQVCNIWLATYWCLGVPNTVLGILTGLSATEVFLPGYTAQFAVATAIVSALMTLINPNQRSEVSHKSGIRFADLRGRVRRYRELHLKAKRQEEVLEDIETFYKEKTELLSQTPHTGGLAYWLARISIEFFGSHKHTVDKERGAVKK